MKKRRTYSPWTSTCPAKVGAAAKSYELARNLNTGSTGAKARDDSGDSLLENRISLDL